MHSRYMAALVVLLVAAILVHPSDARCNMCGEFDVACVNETHYAPCFGSMPDTTQLFDCGTGKVCVSSSRQKCVPAGQGPAADCAKSEESCGLCEEGKIFACISETSFVQCDGNVATNKTGQCPPDLFCDTSKREICVNECQASKPLECTRKTAA